MASSAKSEDGLVRTSEREMNLPTSGHGRLDVTSPEMFWHPLALQLDCGDSYDH